MDMLSPPPYCQTNQSSEAAETIHWWVSRQVQHRQPRAHQERLERHHGVPCSWAPANYPPTGPNSGACWITERWLKECTWLANENMKLGALSIAGFDGVGKTSLGLKKYRCMPFWFLYIYLVEKILRKEFGVAIFSHKNSFVSPSQVLLCSRYVWPSILFKKLKKYYIFC